MIDDRCSGCHGEKKVINEWTDEFDREVDRIMDTQGLSGNDAINQALKRFPNVYFINCPICNGTGRTIK